jgi:phage-related protein (TIGR01555 family)
MNTQTNSQSNFNSYSADSFNNVMNRLGQKANTQAPNQIQGVPTNALLDQLIKSHSLILRQVEIPTQMCFRIEPIFVCDTQLKTRKIRTQLRKGRWLLKMQKAMELGFRYGAAYLVIRTVGESDLSLPLTLGEIVETRLYTQEELREHRTEMETSYLDPEFYLHNAAPIHTSRILKFYGKRRYGYDLRQNQDRHMSIWEPSFPLFEYYTAALEASLAMLKDSSVGIFKMKGLIKALRNAKTQKCKSELEANLYNRISSLAFGMSITNKIVIDGDEEEFEFVERDYANVEKIVGVFRSAFAEATDLPQSFLFTDVASSTFSDSGKADRELMASKINALQQSQLTPNYDVLVACALGTWDAEYEIEYPSTIQLTESEKAQLLYQLSQSHTALIASGVVTPQAIARRHANCTVDASLNLTEEEIAKASDEVISAPDEAAIGRATGGTTNNLNQAGFVEGGRSSEKRTKPEKN